MYLKTGEEEAEDQELPNISVSQEIRAKQRRRVAKTARGEAKKEHKAES